MKQLLANPYCCTCDSWKPQRSVYAGFCGQKSVLKMHDEICATWKPMEAPMEEVMAIPYNIST